jgi:hypothetical protein
MKNCLRILLFILFSLNSIKCSEGICSWIDLPKQPISFYIGYHDQSFDLVNSLIDKYHGLDKLDEANLGDRSKLLGEISLTFDQVAYDLEDRQKSEVLTRLSLIARKKAEYLNRLNYIFEVEIDSYEKMHIQYAGDKQEIDGFFVLPLINKVIYATNLPSYWGLFWLEALDPCHRMLTPYYVKWKEDKDKTPFFMWLEGQEIPYYIFQIELFDDEKLSQLQYNISTEDGLVYNSNCEKTTLNTENEEYIFVITLDKKILISKSSQTVRHFSLTAGKPVLSAGSIKILDGKIIYVDGESGHYMPSVFYINQTINLLMNLGANLDEKVNIKYYQDKKVVRKTLAEFLKEYQCIPPHFDTHERYILDFVLK